MFKWFWTIFSLGAPGYLIANVSVKHESTYWGHYLITSLLETSFLSHFKTLSVGPVPGIEPATSRSVVPRFTDWVNPAAANGFRLPTGPASHK